MSSLWRGKDHLVYVKGSGYLIPLTEEYKRYRFEDIQAISISEKSRIGLAIVHSMGLLFFAGPLILVLSLINWETFGIGAAVSISILTLGALFFLSLLMRHLILGPVCICDLQTNLSRDRIRPLNRLHASRECVAAIESDIRAAQSGMTEDAEGKNSETVREADPREGERFSIPLSVVPTFAGMMAFGLGALATLHLESVVLTGMMLLVLLLVSFLITFSLITSVRKPTPESIRSLLWVMLGLLFVFLGTATVYLLISAVNDPVYTLDFMGPLEALTGVASGGGIGFYLVFVILSLGFFGAGLGGILNTMKWRTRIRQAKMVEKEPEPPVKA
ncbi:MAG: hypothetical protein P1U68_11905 [Verrucomicrobiales bacterium]|nr:hypothetical protein [Verrucomicrobiales bacterium]